MALVGGALYDVSDPVHPLLLCQFANTSVHLVTGDTFAYLRPADGSTQVILHSMGSGNETVIGAFPLSMYSPSGGYMSWTADATLAANLTQDTDQSGNAILHVWLSSGRGATELYVYPLPLTDCICRFGLPAPTLAFSADGQYLVSGWPVGKGAMPLRVYRVADEALVKTFDVNAGFAAWSHAGHRLLLFSAGGDALTWTPEDGSTALVGAAWRYVIGLAADDQHVAYTAYGTEFVPATLRVYVYDIAAEKTRMLVDRMRTEAVFVRDGWVWYDEEAACDPAAAGCTPGGSAPTGKVFAMNLAGGIEVPVVFAAGESPTDLQSGWPLGLGSGPVEYWPNS